MCGSSPSEHLARLENPEVALDEIFIETIDSDDDREWAESGWSEGAWCIAEPRLSAS
jgi:hypothetical protein